MSQIVLGNDHQYAQTIKMIDALFPSIIGPI